MALIFSRECFCLPVDNILSYYIDTMTLLLGVLVAKRKKKEMDKIAFLFIIVYILVNIFKYN
jgi:EamA domain-containing membrane protein RarD